MTWDSQNRMLQCVTGTGTSQKTSSFAYGSDGLRRRMQVVSNNGNPTYTTDYVLDGTSVVQELTTTAGNVNPVVTATYLMGPSGPLYKRPTNSTDVRWYVFDGGGNIVGEVDPAGNLTSSKKHDVYGATRSSSGSVTSKQGWQGGVGHQSDGETGLVYMRARYYAPELGRFQSEDPGRDGSNWYSYCYNNPINKVDETGKQAFDLWPLVQKTLGRLIGDIGTGTLYFGEALLVIGVVAVILSFTPLIASVFAIVGAVIVAAAVLEILVGLLEREGGWDMESGDRFSLFDDSNRGLFQ